MEDRSTIHAGHQLSAEEFRYLRTVRVTAAVYWSNLYYINLSILEDSLEEGIYLTVNIG